MRHDYEVAKATVPLQHFELILPGSLVIGFAVSPRIKKPTPVACC